jgi:hypothetical protein
MDQVGEKLSSLILNVYKDKNNSGLYCAENKTVKNDFQIIKSTQRKFLSRKALLCLMLLTY